MGAISSLYIRIKGDATHFESTLSGVERSLKRSGSKLKAAGSDLTKGITVPILGAGAAIIALGENWDGLIEKVKVVSPSVAKEMEDIGNSVRGALKSAAAWFEKLDPHLKEFIVKVGLGAAALGPFVYAIGTGEKAVAALIGIVKKLSPAIAAAKVAIESLNTALGTTGLLGTLTKITAPIAILVAGSYGLGKLSDKILGAKEDTREFTGEMEKLGGALKDLVNERAGLLGGEGLLVPGLIKDNENAEQLTATCENLVNRLKYEFDDLDKQLAKNLLFSHKDQGELFPAVIQPHGPRGGEMPQDPLVPFKDLGRSVKRELSEMAREFRDFTIYGLNSTADALADLATGGKVSFHEFAKSIERDLISMTIRAAVLAPLLRALNFNVAMSGGGLTEGPNTSGSPEGGAYIVHGFGMGTGGPASESAKVVINNYGTPIEGDVSAKVASGPSGEQVVYLTILGGMKKALRSGALAPEMALYGGRRVGTV